MLKLRGPWDIFISSGTCVLAQCDVVVVSWLKSELPPTALASKQVRHFIWHLENVVLYEYFITLLDFRYIFRAYSLL